MHPSSDLTYRRLVAAIVARAVRDAKSADAGRAIEARAWLESEACDLLDALDLDLGAVTAWVGRLPDLLQPALL